MQSEILKDQEPMFGCIVDLATTNGLLTCFAGKHS